MDNVPYNSCILSHRNSLPGIHKKGIPFKSSHIYVCNYFLHKRRYYSIPLASHMDSFSSHTCILLGSLNDEKIRGLLIFPEKSVLNLSSGPISISCKKKQSSRFSDNSSLHGFFSKETPSGKKIVRLGLALISS